MEFFDYCMQKAHPSLWLISFKMQENIRCSDCEPASCREASITITDLLQVAASYFFTESGSLQVAARYPLPGFTSCRLQETTCCFARPPASCRKASATMFGLLQFAGRYPFYDRCLKNCRKEFHCSETSMTKSV